MDLLLRETLESQTGAYVYYLSKGKVPHRYAKQP